MVECPERQKGSVAFCFAQFRGKRTGNLDKRPIFRFFTESYFYVALDNRLQKPEPGIVDCLTNKVKTDEVGVRYEMVLEQLSDPEELDPQFQPHAFFVFRAQKHEHVFLDDLLDLDEFSGEPVEFGVFFCFGLDFEKSVVVSKIPYHGSGGFVVGKAFGKNVLDTRKRLVRRRNGPAADIGRDEFIER